MARRWTGVKGGTCDVCKRTVSPVQACWECVPCNWWACDECNSLAVAAERAEAEEAGLSVEEWQACRSSGRECNSLAVAAERAEAENTHDCTKDFFDLENYFSVGFFWGAFLPRPSKKRAGSNSEHAFSPPPLTLRQGGMPP